jgi:hypothetical protein
MIPKNKFPTVNQLGSDFNVIGSHLFLSLPW